MNKLFTRISKSLLGLSMAVGVGVAVGSNAEAERVDAATGDTYEKVTDASNIANGDQIIFVNQDGNLACGTTQNTNNRTPVAITLSNGKYVKKSNDNVQEFTVVAGSTSGQFGFHTGSGYIYSASSSKNNLKTNSTASSTKPSGTSAWTISISSEGTSVVNVTNSSYYLAFNGTNYFSQYKTGQSKTTVYKKVTSSNKTATQVSVTAANGKTTLDSTSSPADTVQLSASVTYNSGANTVSNASVTWSGNNNSVATINSSGLVTAVGVGSVTFTASYNGDDTYLGSSATIFIMVNDPNVATFNFGDLATAYSWVNGTAYSPVVVNNVTLTANSGGNNAKYYTSDKTWRMYSGGSLTINAPTGRYISSITSNPEYTFNIASGAASASATFSATTSFKEIVVTLTSTVPQVLYTVSYNANLIDYTGSVPATATQESQGAAVTVASALVCDGYTFNGWNTQSNGEGTNVTPGATNYVPSANVTLYGQWTENQTSGNVLIFDFTSNPGDWPTENSTTLTDYTYTLGGDDYIFSLKNVKSNSGYLMCTSTAVLGLPALSGYKLTKVVAYNSNACSTSTNVGISSSDNSESYIDGGTKKVWSTAGSSYSYNLTDTDENVMYYLYVTSKNAQILSLKLTYEEVETKTIVSSRIVAGTVSATSGDTEWTLSGFRFFVTYEGESETEVTDSTTFTVSPQNVPVITASGTTSVTVTGTYKTESKTTGSIQATLTFINPIRALYDKANGADVDVYGYYVGFMVGTGPIIMDGEYGIVIYSKTHDVSNYTEGETILHVTGSISIFNGLYEIGSPSISIATDASRNPDVPEVYAIQGNETKYEQNRLTHVSGVVSVVSGDLSSEAGTSDISLTFTKNATSVSVFYKKAAQNAETMSKLSDAVSSQEEITIKCFTGWYNAFQVQLVSVIEATVGYTAEDFAQQLLDATDAVCSVWDGHSSNKVALVSVWNSLSDDEHYQALLPSEKEAFASATPDYENDSADVVENAAGRYNMLVKKYSLSNFASRTDCSGAPVSVAEANLLVRSNLNDNGNFIAIIIIISMTSITIVNACLFIKKRRVQQK